MEKVEILQVGSFGSGFRRRVMDASIQWPAATSEAGMRYWKHLSEDDPSEFLRRCAILEQSGNVKWLKEMFNHVVS